MKTCVKGSTLYHPMTCDPLAPSEAGHVYLPAQVHEHEPSAPARTDSMRSSRGLAGTTPASGQTRHGRTLLEKNI